MHKSLYPDSQSFADPHESNEATTPECTPRDPLAGKFWERSDGVLDLALAFTRVKDASFAAEDFRIRWFYDGTLNVSANCLDRHLEKRGDKTAIIWESDDPALSERLSYRELYERVCQCANALRRSACAGATGSPSICR